MFTNKRVNSLSRNNNYKTTINSISYIEEEEIDVGSEKPIEKNKANLLVGWEGAQYRRVRKIA